MKRYLFAVLSLIIAVSLSLAPCCLAETANSATAREYVSMPDYLKVRWSAECGGQRVTLNGEPDQNERLEIKALPGATWTLGAELIRVRDGQLIPYRGETDVTRYCQWTGEGLTVSAGTVRLPVAEGVYTLTAAFTDDEGNRFVCDMVFSVSEGSERTYSIVPEPRSGAATTVEEKVAQLVEQCRAMGYTTQYEIAVWLHDWLIYNANYDYTYENHDADGVLLKGTGVCDSYSKAFQLLLNEFGIENQRVISVEMNHAWNIVKLDGVWCHIDCTWDDPGEGGDENHVYFGMNAALMGRDHVWSDSYPSATSLDNYYPLRQGLFCFSTQSELDAILSEQAGKQASPITIVYIGDDADQTAPDAMRAWVGDNYWKYGLVNYRMHGTRYIYTLETGYTDPWAVPENHLETPVDAPDFTMDSPVGRYRLKNYGNNGVVVIFGRTTCMNTRGLLSMLSPHLSDIYDSGVDVLVSMVDAADPEDLEAIEALYPGFHYAYNCGLMWQYLDAVGFPTENGVVFPCVFVINRQARITYYSTGYLSNINQLTGEITAVATNNPLPEPEKHPDIEPMLNGSGNVNDIEDGESIVSAVQSAAANHHVILLLNYSVNSSLMGYYENHYSLFNKLGIAMIASIRNITDEEMAAYPHCAFVAHSQNDFWALQYATGYEGRTSVSSLLNMLILKGGDIAAYAKGATLNPGDCALHIARQTVFDTTIPASLSVLEEEAFSNTAFRRLDLNNGSLREIHAGALAHCGKLEIVRIPESVTSIADGAFGSTDPIIICTVGTAGHRYAREHGLDYVCE